MYIIYVVYVCSICVYYIYVCCMRICICVYAFVRMCMHIWVCMCMRTRMCMCAVLRIHVCTYAHARTYTPTASVRCGTKVEYRFVTSSGFRVNKRTLPPGPRCACRRTPYTCFGHVCVFVFSCKHVTWKCSQKTDHPALVHRNLHTYAVVFVLHGNLYTGFRITP